MTMKLYVMRHGEAQFKGKDDSDRSLTSDGSSQTRNTCEIARMLGCKPAVFISSPLLRAKQSAEIAKEVLNPQADLRIENCLQPDAKVEDVYKVLSKIKGAESVMLVTHLPLGGLLIRDLLDWHVERRNLDYDPSAIVEIECRKTRPKSKAGNLTWLLPPIKVLPNNTRG
jgi:phosphohistidine phosphatase